MFLKMIAELTPCAKAVSTACSRSHSLPSSFPPKVKFGLLWIYAGVFFLLIRPPVKWSLSCSSHHFHPIFSLILSFQHLYQSQMPLSNIKRPQPLKESVSKQALPHLPGPTCLHGIVKKRRLTRGKRLRKAVAQFSQSLFSCLEKGKDRLSLQCALLHMVFLTLGVSALP